METERVWPPSFVALRLPLFHDRDPGRGDSIEVIGAVLNEKVGRWPLVGSVGAGPKVLGLTCAGAFLCPSPPGAKPLMAACCSDVLEDAGVVAIFLKVIWHSISSPAKTVCSVHCTKTRILLNGVDMSLIWSPTLLQLERRPEAPVMNAARVEIDGICPLA